MGTHQCFVTCMGGFGKITLDGPIIHKFRHKANARFTWIRHPVKWNNIWMLQRTPQDRLARDRLNFGLFRKTQRRGRERNEPCGIGSLMDRPYSPLI